ncbi:MAG: non-canonical purine NTP pyrophosphatase [Lachnospiraceae bacterium]|jgi:XTP/dITP diphosphohydrolase|nr:non-canonical purine NTP pyrophosphatase [Lachnospiraceae bacterium]
MKVLMGSTNPSKIEYYTKLLAAYPVTVLSLTDLNITSEPEEGGKTPEENAVIKAKYYGKFFETVICNDSGLYLDAFPIEDARQPGLHVRTPMGRPRLDDDSMVAYYTELSRSLGGKMLAYYLNGYAVYHKGKIDSYMESREEKRKTTSFYLLDHEIAPRRAGWPLDSISLRNKQEYVKKREKDLIPFLVQALGLA